MYYYTTKFELKVFLNYSLFGAESLQNFILG